MTQVIASTYELIEKLGSGGGGKVYLAQHLRLDKKVVVKADKRKNTVSQELLRREADVLKELSHPHIPRVYDYFMEGDISYTVMDYIEGENLKNALKRGERFPQPQVIRWACQLLDALQYLHSPIHGNPPKGFVHSDIKPANLMRTPNGDICLIDFNIALALGEESIIGRSTGYASPEHYGYDFSSGYDAEYGDRTETDTDATWTLEAKDLGTQGDSMTAAIGEQFSLYSYRSSSCLRKRNIIPDVRSDIYEVGATLYHLLSGVRPAADWRKVVPLSTKNFSPQVVQIISRGMNPNPDLRYQTAEEMRRDFLNLWKNDPRMRRWKKCRLAASVLFPVFILLGASVSYTGLRRMQRMENWLRITEHTQETLDKGDAAAAAAQSVKILSESQDQFMPEQVPGIQKVLTEALGVYDLSDGYKRYKIKRLPSAPLDLAIAPDGKTAAVLYGNTVEIFDTKSTDTLAELSAENCALSEIVYLDEHTILYAGNGGIKAYDLYEKRELWSGNSASYISMSGDRSKAAASYEQDTKALVYDTGTGEIRSRIDFGGKSQSIALDNHLLALNKNGSLLGVSFEDGSLHIYDVERPETETAVLNADSGYTHFEGGFCGKYFAFSASNKEESMFAVIDTEEMSEAGGFKAESEAAFGVQTDENGIYVRSENVLVKIDPATGKQTPLVSMDENILRFISSDLCTMVTSESNLYFFDKNARLLSRYAKEYKSDLAEMSGGTALLANRDQPEIRIMQYQEKSEAELFSYDPDYEHDETRVSADGKTVMLYSYGQFRIYGKDGSLLQEVTLPESNHVLDQQFIREGKGSFLEVHYDNGTKDIYSARDGALLREETGGKKSESLDEEFLIDDMRIESPLHGTPVVYDAQTGKEIARLKEDTYLTDVTKAGSWMVAQYITADGECSGQILDKSCTVLAELPYLCDVKGETLIFDYPSGSIRESEIYSIEELMEMAGNGNKTK